MKNLEAVRILLKSNYCEFDMIIHGKKLEEKKKSYDAARVCIQIALKIVYKSDST